MDDCRNPFKMKKKRNFTTVETLFFSMKHMRYFLFIVMLLTVLFANWSMKIRSEKNKFTNSAACIDLNKKIKLGRMLFYDPVLSGDNTVSCASCHKQKFAFADTAKFSKGIHGKLTKRNTMSLVNLKWSDHFFWDGRANSLEEQILFPIQDSMEMGQNIEELAQELNKDPQYRKMFSGTYGKDSIEMQQVISALTEFVKNISSADTPMDYIFSSPAATQNSDNTTMSELFKNGIENFLSQRDIQMNKNLVEKITAKSLHSDNLVNAFVLCIQCHDKNFFQPPALLRNNGLALQKNDLGLGSITGKKEDEGLFKVPTLRNISLTAPYMHDGRFKTLNEVIQHYNNGIEQNENLDTLLMKNGKPLRLNLTQKEINEMVGFMELLTDSIYLSNPEFSNPF